MVRRHLAAPWLQPLHQPSVAAFERLTGLAGFDPGHGLVLDSGCGTGVSTGLIAKAHPDCLVIGIDRSGHRLSRLGSSELPLQRDNTIWVQAELATFWRLILEAGWRIERHYLLYPNPWPKPGQLLRRWHAHPVFPQGLALGGVLELRCNWKVYAEEFEQALRLVRPEVRVELESASSEQGWGGMETPFGRKYGLSGHRLYRLVVDLTVAEA
jgi:tRNA (guanine-N7-)-methyltransferase